ncbi:hypothetical protein AMEX_G8291 [Astyanax mexicanus]|uniref:Uncharacterized protein n=1 Tax=Astyanax mexicanus TaxID=7994 RepID=A0A8T2LUT9_ASTMX|nr:hypothetical protein AMEX_G8291 [Astyanax mexicanus]
MTPTVLLLLSMVYTVRGSGCNDLAKSTVNNLQTEISEKQTEFFTVFPRNYFVPRFNDSTQCQDQTASCCLFSEVVLLSHSWAQLLRHLHRTHLMYKFITNLKIELDDISKEGFQDPPDPSDFPSVLSSPETLLNFTSSLLSKWLELNCPSGEKACIFPDPFTSEEDEEEEEEVTVEIPVEIEGGGVGIGDGEAGPKVEGNVGSECGEKEGLRERRWITSIPTNGDSGLSTSPGLVLCALYFLCGW